MKYKILRGKASEVNGLVNEHLTHGWELYGQPFNTGNEITISVSSNYGQDHKTSEIAQAMIKINEEEDNEAIE